MEKKNKGLIILVTVLALIAVGLVAYIVIDRTDLLKGKEEQGEKTEIIDVKLVDPSTEEFDGVCTTSIESSKYLKKQDGVQNFATLPENAVINKETSYYYANLTLGNINAALDERAKCYMTGVADTYCDENFVCTEKNYQVEYTITDQKIGNNIVKLNGAASAYYMNVYVNNELIGAGGVSIYTFNDEYLVIIISGMTGPDNDNIYIYDESGNNVFTLENVTLDYYDYENDKLKEKITYTQHCSKFFYVDQYETATFGKIKYDTVNKKFINETEEKSVDQYCKNQ